MQLKQQLPVRQWEGKDRVNFSGARASVEVARNSLPYRNPENVSWSSQKVWLCWALFPSLQQNLKTQIHRTDNREQQKNTVQQHNWKQTNKQMNSDMVTSFTHTPKPEGQSAPETGSTMLSELAFCLFKCQTPNKIEQLTNCPSFSSTSVAHWPAILFNL